MKVYKVNRFSMEFQENGMSFMSRINKKELARYYIVFDENAEMTSITLHLNRSALKDHPEKDKEEISYVAHEVAKSYGVKYVEEWIKT